MIRLFFCNVYSTNVMDNLTYLYNSKTNQLNQTGVTELTRNDLVDVIGYGRFVIDYLHNNNLTDAILTESNAGPLKNTRSLLDFKTQVYRLFGLDPDQLISIDGTAFNPNEAGNYLWGMILEYEGSSIPANLIAEGGSRLSGRADERNEQKAITLGRQKVKELNFSNADSKRIDRLFDEFRIEYNTYLDENKGSSLNDQNYVPSSNSGIYKYGRDVLNIDNPENN